MKSQSFFTVFFLCLFLLLACDKEEAEVPKVIQTAHFSSNEFVQSQVQIKETIDAIFKSIQDKDAEKLASFHVYDNKFTEFQNGELRTGAAENEAAERALVEAISSFDYDLNDLKIDVYYGNVGKVTFHADFRPTIDGQQFQQTGQVTLVLIRVGNDWKIVHEHFSPLIS